MFILFIKEQLKNKIDQSRTSGQAHEICPDDSGGKLFLKFEASPPERIGQASGN
jgi:hypothetical protein